ncbi:MAG TPA: hypothetical protein VFY40_27455 [Blastocatellia bacterium]|nr:hypothetical protein [Blastocatellia bacterium]
MANEDQIRNIVREIVRQALTGLNVEGPSEKNPGSPSVYYAPWTGMEYEAHPSRQQFDVREATVSASDLLEFVESKLCSIEKNKPCDHCGMCRNLGF